MKKRITHQPGAGVKVPSATRFELVRPEAREVFLAGTFNDWHPTAFPMVAGNNGKWLKNLSLPPGRYEYLFVVDGVWVTDLAASESVPNPHGGVNSVIVVSANA